MCNYRDRFMQDMMSGGPEKAMSGVLASVQNYSNQILTVHTNDPEADMVCFIAAVKLLNQSFKNIFPKEYSLANGLSNLIHANALIVDTMPDGTGKHITHFKDVTKG